MALATAVATPAAAGPNDGGSAGNSSNGFTVTAKVTLSGDGAPSEGTRPMPGVPVKCYWAPAQLNGNPDVNDPAAVKKWWEENMPGINGSFAVARSAYGSAESFNKAVADAAAGQDLTYYGAHCSKPDYFEDFNAGMVNAGDDWRLIGDNGEPVTTGFPVTFAFFPTGQEPDPLVDPEELAQWAWDQIVLVNPNVDRNPKLAGDDAGATLVGLDTFFWVTNPESVGGREPGTRTIRAEVGDVFAEVTATTKTLDLSSPAGGKDCPVAAARREYTKGADPDGACTVSFTRASVGNAAGHPVTATVTWTPQAQTNEGPVDGLEVKIAQAVVQVPVAESQAIVTRGD
jgi:hypothetical protein